MNVSCVHGHPWTPENTRIRPDGARACRACARATTAGRNARIAPLLTEEQREAKRQRDRMRKRTGHYVYSPAQVEARNQARRDKRALATLEEDFARVAALPPHVYAKARAVVFA